MGSFYDDSSLVLIPSGYKAGTVYSVKPTDGTGDMTFTRTGDTATRVASNGLIEKVRTNLISYSEQFDNAYWNKYAGATVAANTTANPLDGLITADTLSVAISNYSGLYIITSGGSANYTLSIYAKKGTKDFLYLVDAAGSDAMAWFNLATGTLGTVNAGYTATITSAGNGWYRCSLRKDTPSIFTYFQFGLSDTDGSTLPTSTGTAYIYGAQAEVSDFGPTPYIPTTTTAVSVGPLANIARIDYPTLGQSGGCGKLLLEPQRTNVLTYSEQFNNAAWQKIGEIVTANAITSPDGYINADKLVPSGTGTNVLYQTAAPVGTFNVSVFAKEGEFGGILISTGATGGFFNLTTGQYRANFGIAPISYSIISYGNGWYKCSVTLTIASIDNLYISVNDNVSNNFTVAGDGVKGIYIYGAQLEVGSYATSYIPTLAAAVTRGVDSCYKTGISSLIGQTAGTLYSEFVVNGFDNFGTPLCINDGGTDESVWLTTFSNGDIRAEVYSATAGGIQATFLKTGNVVGQTYKIAIGYAANNFAFFVNGVQVGTTDTSGTVPVSMSRVDFDYTIPSSFVKSALAIQQALVFPTRLSNAQISELTTI